MLTRLLQLLARWRQRRAAGPDNAIAVPESVPVASDAATKLPRRAVRSPGTFSEHVFRCPAGSRHFKLFIPGAPRDRNMPLVVMLHGCKQTPDDFATGTRMNDFAQRLGFVVVYPAQSKLENIARCWNWFRPSDQLRGSGEPAIIAELTLDVARAQGIDPSRIFIAGMSAGGAMALIMAKAYPELYAAVAVHSGVVPGVASSLGSALAAMRDAGMLELVEGSRETADRTVAAPRVLAIHGDLDKTVSVQNGLEACARRVRLAAADSLHAAVDTVSQPGAHACTRTRWARANGEVIVELWVVHRGGHAWFGGDARGSHTDAQGPDATAAILGFFGLDPQPG